MDHDSSLLHAVTAVFLRSGRQEENIQGTSLYIFRWTFQATNGTRTDFNHLQAIKSLSCYLPEEIQTQV